jgi:hypothetical protein
MPEIITCPDCQRKLRVPDALLGKKVKCPGCSVMFTAGGAPPKVSRPAPPPEEPIEEPIEDRRDVVRRDDYEERRPRRRDDDYDDDDRRSRRRDDNYDDDRRFRRDDDYDDDRRFRRDDDYDDYRMESPRSLRERWGKVSTGINLNIIGTWIWIGGAVFMALGSCLGGLIMGSAVFAAIGSGGRASSATADSTFASVGAGLIIFGLAAIVFGLCALAELVLRVTGYGMCMTVPSTRGASLKPLAVTAFSLGAAQAVFLLFGCTWGFAAGASGGMGGGTAALMPVGGNVIDWIAKVLFLASFIVFLLFARGVASQVRDRGLPGTLLTLLIVFAVFHVLQWLAALAVVLGAFATAFGAIGSSSAASAANKVTTFGVLVLVLGGLMFLAYLGLEIWYIFVLGRLREGIQRHIKKLGRE